MSEIEDHAFDARSAKHMLCIVFAAAAAVTVAMILAATTGWTERGDRDFKAADGGLLGIGAMVMPATAVGVYIAFGGNLLERRIIRSMFVLSFAPLIAMLSITIPRLMRDENSRLRDEHSLFASFAALATGLCCMFMWTFVAVANASPLVPPGTASHFASCACVLVLVPLAYLVLLLTWKNGREFSRWFGNAEEDDDADGDGTPPVTAAAALGVIYATCLGILIPVLRVRAVGWDLFDPSDKYGTGTTFVHKTIARRFLNSYVEWPFAYASLVCTCCACTAAFALVSSGPAPVRVAVAVLLTSTPTVLVVATTITARMDSTAKIWIYGTWQFVLPVFGLALLMLRATLTRANKAIWWRIISVACFCAAAVVTIVLLIVAPLQKRERARKFGMASEIVAVCVFPWWLATLVAAGAVHQSRGGGLCVPVLLCALTTSVASAIANFGSSESARLELRSCWLWLLLRRQKNTLVNSSTVHTNVPQRIDIFWMMPHATLLLSILYLSLNTAIVHLRIGGFGILLGSATLAPLATYGGISLLRKTTPSLSGPWWRTQEAKVVASPLCLIMAMFVVYVLVKRRVRSFFHFELGWAAEVKAAALWCVVAVPASVAGWRLVALGASVWRTGAVARPLPLISERWGYYAGLLAHLEEKMHNAPPLGENSVACESSKSGQKLPSLGASLRDGLDLSTIRGDEAMPLFASLFCLVFLVPFGVFAPLAFVTKFGPLGLSHRTVMAYLGFAVIFGVTVVTYASNASLDRIKAEERTKRAAFELRLALRKRRVIVSAKIARLLHEAREKHVHYVSQLIKKRTKNGTLQDNEVIAANAADVALRDELATSETRVSRTIEIQNRDHKATKTALLAGESPQKQRVNMLPSSNTRGAKHLETSFAASVDLGEEDDADHKDLVFWRNSKHEADCMELVTLEGIFAEIRHNHEYELEILWKTRRQAAGRPKHSTISQTTECAEEENPHKMLKVLAPQWFCNVEGTFEKKPLTLASLFGWCCLETSRPKVSAAPSTEASSLSESGANSTDSDTPAANEKMKQPKMVKVVPKKDDSEEPCEVWVKLAAVAEMYEHLRVQTNRTMMDDVNFNTHDVNAAMRRVTWFERKSLACARWRVLLDIVPAFMERSWKLRAPSKESTLSYRQALLPRAFCHYATPAVASKQQAGIDLGDWLAFLDDARILEGGTNFTSDQKRSVSRSKAELVYKTLPKSGVNARGNSIVTYASFRQAMRQTAAVLYPKVPESDALKLLGQKHVFPNTKLAPASCAWKWGLLPDQSCREPAPRLLDFLQVKATARASPDEMKAVAAAFVASKQSALARATERKESSAPPRSYGARCGDLAGKLYGRRLCELRRSVLDAETSLEHLSRNEKNPSSLPVLTATTMALLLSKKDRGDSPEARALEELETQAAAEEAQDEMRRHRLVGGCGFGRLRGLFALAQPKANLGDAQMELALLKVGAETTLASHDRPSDWAAVCDEVVLSLRTSTDDAKDQAAERHQLYVSPNIDNAFAVFELVIEAVSFATLAFQGAGAYAWGLTRSCELDADCPKSSEGDTSSAKSLVATMTKLPLMTLGFDVMAQFWSVCALCVIVPVYLLKAVEAARQQRIGLSPDGSKLHMFTPGWWYFNSIKLLQSTMPPVMTTLVNVLVCDRCGKRLSRMSTRCASLLHVAQLTAALVATIAYYPAIAYIQPQLQFKSKALDLKFEPSYLVVLAQGKMVLAGAVNFFSVDRYSVNCVNADVTRYILVESVQLIILAGLIAAMLAWHTWRTQPCIVAEFNTVRACTLSSAAACLWMSATTFALRRFVVGESARYFGILLLFAVLGPIAFIATRAARRMLVASAADAKVQPTVS